MAAPESSDDGRVRARAVPASAGIANVETGVPVLDHLVGLLARYGSFELQLEVAPSGAGAEVAASGRALGGAVRELLRAEGARGHGAATLPADEALAQVAIETTETPRLFSNVDLSSERLGGLGHDLVADFLRELAGAAGITLHVRLIEGDDARHVLDAIFKALGAALADACRPRP